MSIETYGMGERVRIAASRLMPLSSNHNIILLPVPTTRDAKTVAKSDIPLADTLVNAADGTLVVGYGLPADFVTRAEALGAETLDLALDEEHLADNARLTAIGALGYILTDERCVPENIRFGIYGYGRIGRELARLLLFLSAHVRVYTSKKLTLLELGEYADGLLTVKSSRDTLDLDDIDILINTAPKDFSREFEEGKIPAGKRIIELASGDNFAGIFGVERLPALPERMYPESAGEAYAEAVKRRLGGGDL